MDINCFIINLKRCSEKRERMIERMKEFPEINYHIFDAIDGQMLTQEYMDQHNYKTLDQWTDPFHNRKTTKGEIGCTLSHYGVYQMAVHSKYDITLVLEDDAEFSDHFIEKLKTTINRLNGIDWDPNTQNIIWYISCVFVILTIIMCIYFMVDLRKF